MVTCGRQVCGLSYAVLQSVHLMCKFVIKLCYIDFIRVGFVMVCICGIYGLKQSIVECK